MGESLLTATTTTTTTSKTTGQRAATPKPATGTAFPSTAYPTGSSFPIFTETDSSTELDIGLVLTSELAWETSSI